MRVNNLGKIDVLGQKVVHKGDEWWIVFLNVSDELLFKIRVTDITERTIEVNFEGKVSRYVRAKAPIRFIEEYKHG